MEYRVTSEELRGLFDYRDRQSMREILELRGELPAEWMQKKVYQRFPRCLVESWVRQGLIKPRKVVSENGGKTAKVFYPVRRLYELEAGENYKLMREFL